jgi:hypothetical protein
MMQDSLTYTQNHWPMPAHQDRKSGLIALPVEPL